MKPPAASEITLLAGGLIMNTGGRQELKPSQIMIYKAKRRYSKFNRLLFEDPQWFGKS